MVLLGVACLCRTDVATLCQAVAICFPFFCRYSPNKRWHFDTVISMLVKVHVN